MDNQQMESILGGAATVINSLPEETKIQLYEKPSKELGEGFANIFFSIFSPFAFARVRIEQSLKDYTNKIATKKELIPEENLIDPPLNIIGPALEASKYHIEEEDIRNMFANLIANSMDDRKKNEVHPSFVEIIKQLSTFEAQLLLKLITVDVKDRAIAQITWDSDSSEYSLRYTNILNFSDIDVENINKYSASMDNLQRLSIIEIYYGSYLPETEAYNEIQKGKLFQHAEEELKNQLLLNNEFKFKNLLLNRGYWRFSTFGINFIASCT